MKLSDKEFMLGEIQEDLYASSVRATQATADCVYSTHTHTLSLAPEPQTMYCDGSDFPWSGVAKGLSQAIEKG